MSLSCSHIPHDLSELSNNIGRYAEMCTLTSTGLCHTNIRTFSFSYVVAWRAVLTSSGMLEILLNPVLSWPNGVRKKPSNVERPIFDGSKFEFIGARRLLTVWIRRDCVIAKMSYPIESVRSGPMHGSRRHFAPANWDRLPPRKEVCRPFWNTLCKRWNQQRRIC